MTNRFEHTALHIFFVNAHEQFVVKRVFAASSHKVGALSKVPRS